jgi:hypothetical protein
MEMALERFTAVQVSFIAQFLPLHDLLSLCLSSSTLFKSITPHVSLIQKTEGGGRKDKSECDAKRKRKARKWERRKNEVREDVRKRRGNDCGNNIVGNGGGIF